MPSRAVTTRPGELAEGAYPNVRSHSRRWPTMVERASGTTLVDQDSNEYLGFFDGAGSLNYGHNPPPLLEGMPKYLSGHFVLNGLGTLTPARQEFLDCFVGEVLVSRGLDYTLQLTGPTGTSAVEAALRLTRINTGRDRSAHRAFDSSEEGPPEACIVEFVQGEGGIRPTSIERLALLRELCDHSGALLIVDDVQAGCGRTARFAALHTELSHLADEHDWLGATARRRSAPRPPVRRPRSRGRLRRVRVRARPARRNLRCERQHREVMLPLTCTAADIAASAALLARCGDRVANASPAPGVP